MACGQAGELWAAFPRGSGSCRCPHRRVAVPRCPTAAGCFGISEQPYPWGQLPPRARHPWWALAQASTASSQPSRVGGRQSRPVGHQHHLGSAEHQGEPTRDMTQGAPRGSHLGEAVPLGPGRAVSGAGTRRTREAGQRVTVGLGHAVPVGVYGKGHAVDARGATRVRDETAAREVGHVVPVGPRRACGVGPTVLVGPCPWVGHAVSMGGACRAHGWDMPCLWGLVPAPPPAGGPPSALRAAERQSHPAPSQAPPPPPAAANEKPFLLSPPLPRCHHTPARGGGGPWAGFRRAASPSIGRAAFWLAPVRALPRPENQSARGRRARGACPQRHPEGAVEPRTVGAAAAVAEGALVGPAGLRRAGPGGAGYYRASAGTGRPCDGVRAPHLHRHPPVPEGSGGPLRPGAQTAGASGSWGRRDQEGP